MIAAAEDDFGDRLPAELARKTEETEEEAALRLQKQRRLIHAREWAAALAFVAIVLASITVSLYVVARWAGWTGTDAAGVWDSTPVRLAAVSVLGLGALLVGWGRFVEPDLVRVRHLEIPTAKLPKTGAPPPTLVFMSDLHVEGRTRRLRRIVGAAREAAPDAILLGGDYLNDEREEAVQTLKETVEALAKTAPVYAVIGNADEPRPASYQAVAAAGAKVLANEHVDLAGGLTVWGLRWLDSEAVKEAATLLDAARVNICLTHGPGMIPEAAGAGFDLYLAGHTHGGQVRLPLWGALVTLSVHGKRFEYGPYRLPEGMDAYVTCGVGPEGGRATRVRFLCVPEVVAVGFRGES